MLDEIQQERAFDDRFRAWLYDEVPRPDVSRASPAVRRALALGMSAGAAARAGDPPAGLSRSAQRRDRVAATRR